MPGLDWLTARPIAHRGLHDAANGVIENIFTLPSWLTTAWSLSDPFASCHSHGPIARHLRGDPAASVSVETTRLLSSSSVTLVCPSRVTSLRKLNPPARLLT